MKTILVVDDEPQIAQIAKDYLQHAGYAVITAGDGSEALALARERRPDLVVLDLGLPTLDGLDVARRLQRDRSIPISSLAGRGDECCRWNGLQLCVCDYSTKPFSPWELVSRGR